MKAPQKPLTYSELLARTRLEPGTKVLFANVPGDGHFNPLTGLAFYLKRIGCDVRWYTAPSYVDKIRKLDIPYYLFHKALDVNASNLEEQFPERAQHRSKVSKLRFDMINVFILRSPEYYEDIKEIKKEFDFSVMICDITFGAIPFVREKLHVPVISIGVVPLVETSRDLPPAGLGIKPSSSLLGRAKQAALRYLADKVLFAQPTKVMQHMLRSFGIDPGPWNIFDVMIKKSNIVLQSGTPGFEYKRSDLGPNIRFAGPLLPYTKKRNTTPWFDERLNRYQKVVIVTQGTVEKDPEKIIVPTLEAFKNTDFLVVATTGGSGTAELKARYPGENLIIEDFIPFDDIMPYADAYVTNGGYGGVLLGIQHELPLVVAGVHEGKNEINARIDYFSLGINLNTEHPTPVQVRGAVQRVVNDSRYKVNVRRLKDEFSTYHPNELCAYYVSELIKESAGKTARTETPLLQA